MLIKTFYVYPPTHSEFSVFSMLQMTFPTKQAFFKKIKYYSKKQCTKRLLPPLQEKAYTTVSYLEDKVQKALYVSLKTEKHYFCI